MTRWDRAKIVADIAKIGSEIYAILVDKANLTRAREERLAKLESRIEELERHLTSRTS